MCSSPFFFTSEDAGLRAGRYCKEFDYYPLYFFGPPCPYVYRRPRLFTVLLCLLVEAGVYELYLTAVTVRAALCFSRPQSTDRYHAFSLNKT